MSMSASAPTPPRPSARRPIPASCWATDDIFLIDIGPVFEKWEGDGGDTFVTGTNPAYAKCAEDARTLFHLVRKKWEKEKAHRQGAV